MGNTTSNFHDRLTESQEELSKRSSGVRGILVQLIKWDVEADSKYKSFRAMAEGNQCLLLCVDIDEFDAEEPLQQRRDVITAGIASLHSQNPQTPIFLLGHSMAIELALTVAVSAELDFLHGMILTGLDGYASVTRPGHKRRHTLCTVVDFSDVLGAVEPAQNPVRPTVSVLEEYGELIRCPVLLLYSGKQPPESLLDKLTQTTNKTCTKFTETSALLSWMLPLALASEDGVEGCIAFNLSYTEFWNQARGATLTSTLAQTVDIDPSCVILTSVRPGSVIADYFIICSDPTIVAGALSNAFESGEFLASLQVEGFPECQLEVLRKPVCVTSTRVAPVSNKQIEDTSNAEVVVAVPKHTRKLSRIPKLSRQSKDSESAPDMCAQPHQSKLRQPSQIRRASNDQGTGEPTTEATPLGPTVPSDTPLGPTQPSDTPLGPTEPSDKPQHRRCVSEVVRKDADTYQPFGEIVGFNDDPGLAAYHAEIKALDEQRRGGVIGNMEFSTQRDALRLKYKI